jgi:hypothetical protein
MQKKSCFVLLLIFAVSLISASQEDYLKISASVEPRVIKQGEEGNLKIKVTPKAGLKISSHPEFMIKLDKNDNFSFPKLFFTASELDFQTRKEKDAVFLELDKEVTILITVNEDSLIGKQKVSGEIIFTAVFKDNWSLKTYQKFTVDFTSKRNLKLKKKKK